MFAEDFEIAAFAESCGYAELDGAQIDTVFLRVRPHARDLRSVAPAVSRMLA